MVLSWFPMCWARSWRERPARCRVARISRPILWLFVMVRGIVLCFIACAGGLRRPTLPCFGRTCFLSHHVGMFRRMPKTTAPNLALRRERFHQQMTRAGLSRTTGLTRSSLLNVEERRSRVRLDTAGRIAKALNCEVADLFSDEELMG